jgi:copper chaperone NosL
MNSNLKWPRLLVILAAVMLAGAFFLPIWKIELTAPQYPEGLVLKISANGLGGDVDIINGLNHYIGMRTMHTEDFIEFKILPFMIGGLIALAVLAAIINRKRFYYFYIALFIVVAIISMVDFYRWEYNYGHDLDPNAAIKVPGMSYQPPLIGYKQLLNFGAYSIPDTGGWLFIGAGVSLAVAYFLILQPKWLRRRKSKTALTGIMLFALLSCASGPLPIHYGRDACDFCKMTIIDKNFACEWLTDKGKAFRFDDIHCLISFRKADKSAGVAYVNDFTGKAELVAANRMYYVTSESLRTPMNGKVAAFVDNNQATAFLKTNNGRELSWQQVNEVLQRN